MSPKMLLILAGLLIFGIGLGLMLYWPMINIVETGKTSEYPNIQPVRFPFTQARVVDGVLHAVNQIPNWSLSSYDIERGEVRAEAKTSLLRFVDDIEVRVVPDGEEKKEVRVEVRSASRVGRGDFGQNARNIRKLFEELKRQLHHSTTQHHAE